jgi:ABC-type sugar transport system substrate-binding protein
MKGTILNRRQLRASLVAVAVAGLVLSACSSSPDASPSDEVTESSAVAEASEAAVDASQWAKDFKWGSFDLAPDIAQRVQDGQPLRVVLSMQGTGIAVFGAQQQVGVDRACAAATAAGLSVECRMVGPASTDTAAQLAELEALLNSSQVDCLVVQTGEPKSFVKTVNQYVDKGIPVFGENGDIADSKRFAFYALDEFEAAKANGELTAAVMAEQGITASQVAVGSGLPTGPWAIARMEGFQAGLEAAIPGVSFFNDAESGLPTGDGFTVEETITAVSPFLRGNPDVNLFFHTDQGVEGVGKVIEADGYLGSRYSTGFNISAPILDAIEKDAILVTVDQGFDNQAEQSVAACINYLSTGAIPAEEFPPLDPILITKSGTNGSMTAADARIRLAEAEGN